MNNKKFLIKIKEAFYKYLDTSSNSNQKLKILHGAIAKDLQQKLGKEYQISSLGYGDSKEIKMSGRYSQKRVDIAIKKDDEILGAIALKFIMRNYSQNSNNYFENMLGETANIRSFGKPYFQIVIFPSKVPYFNKDKDITKIETITRHNISKYIVLSNDNINEYMHIPNKTLLYLVDMPMAPSDVCNFEQYRKYYKKNKSFEMKANEEQYDFGKNIIYNDYEKFIEKIICYIKSI